MWIFLWYSREVYLLMDLGLHSHSAVVGSPGSIVVSLSFLGLTIEDSEFVRISCVVSTPC